MIDNRHTLVLDDGGRIQEFRFKTADDNIIKTKFVHSTDGQDTLMFEDGTRVVISQKDVTVTHGNCVLSYDTRREFAATYEKAQITPWQIIKGGNGR